MQGHAFTEEIDCAVRSIASQFYRRIDPRRHSGTYEDWLSEARIAALIAIRKFDATKKVKLKTYVTGCVKNRLIDINKVQYYKKRGSYHSLSEKDESGLIYENTDLEWILDARILDEKEKEAFSMILAGYSLKEISEKFKEEYELKTKREAGRIVKKCFSRIWQKLKSPEMSQTLIRSQNQKLLSEETSYWPKKLSEKI